MKKFLLFLVSFLLGTGLLIWIGGIVGWEQIKSAFSIFEGWKGIVILSLTALIMLIRGLVWQEGLRSQNIHLPFKEVFRIYLAAFSIRFLAPIITIGDEIFQVYALKKKNFTSWSVGAAAVIIERVLEWTANSLTIFFGVLLFLLFSGFPSERLITIFVIAFLISILGILFFYSKVFKRESLIKTFGKFFNYSVDAQPLELEKALFNFFDLKKIPFWRGCGLSFFRIILMYLRTWLLIIFLGKSVGPLPVFSILGFSFLATIIPIPTSLGSHEALQTFVFSYFNLGLNTAIAFTMIIRAAELIVALIGVIILFRLGINLLNNTLFKKYLKN